MPEYLAPGVYVEEIPSGNMPIQAASTSTAGTVGMTARGPAGRPVLCTSLGDYTRKFGGRLNPLVFTDHKDALPYAAEGFFNNGGARLYVVRVVGAGAEEATLVLNSTVPYTLAANAAAGDTTVTLTSVAGLAVNDTIRVGNETFTISAINANVLTLSAALTSDVPLGDPASFDTIEAVNRQLAADAAIADTTVELDDVTGLIAGAVLTIGGETPTVTIVDAITNIVTLDVALTVAATSGDPVSFDQTVTVATTIAADADAGDTIVTLADTAGLAVGDTLTINGDDYLVALVDHVSDQVTLGAALTAAAATGDPALQLHAAMTVHAQWPGIWGNALNITSGASHILESELTAAATAGDTTITLATAFGLFAGSAITIAAEPAVVQAVDTTSGLVTLTAPLQADAAAAAPVVSQEFSLTVERIENNRVAESESFDKLSLAPGHPRNAADIIGSWNAATDRPSDSGASELIRLEVSATANTFHLQLAAVSGLLTDGLDDEAAVTAASYVGTFSDDPVDRTGIQALENEPSISIVAVPGQTDLTVQKALVAHCEKMRYRFAALDVPLGAKLGPARAHRQNFDSTRCAVYYPGLVIADSFGNPGDRRVIASTGHVLGIYARTDITRGVHKAPANEVVRGILGFETGLTKGEQDILNPINLNCFRDFRSENRGLRIYGGRVATSNPEFRYVNVRRLMLFIEQSLDTGLQWAVFEPNAEPLWDTVLQSISGFLTTVWRDGALEGTTTEQAFFVRIGYDVTMTQADIDNGKLIAEIGVAPVKPAEYVILRISQKTREATA